MDHQDLPQDPPRGPERRLQPPLEELIEKIRSSSDQEPDGLAASVTSFLRDAVFPFARVLERVPEAARHATVRAVLEEVAGMMFTYSMAAKYGYLDSADSSAPEDSTRER